MGAKQRRVVCAAVRNGITGDLVMAPRHFDTPMHAVISTMTHVNQGWREADQGFVDQWGRFMDRQEAWKVAKAAGQILYRCGGDDANGGTLYSENLY